MFSLRVQIIFLSVLIQVYLLQRIEWARYCNLKLDEMILKGR